MSSDTEPEKKPDSGAPKVMPEPDVVEQTEFTIKVSCQKTANGTRSCKIQEITEINPAKDQVTVAPLEIPKADTPVDAAVTPAPKCNICEIVADLVTTIKDKKLLTEKDVTVTAAQGRRFEDRSARDGPEPAAPRRHENRPQDAPTQQRLTEWVRNRRNRVTT